MSKKNWVAIDISGIEPGDEIQQSKILMEFPTEDEAIAYAKKKTDFVDDGSMYSETWVGQRGDLHEFQSGEGYNIGVCREDDLKEMAEFAVRNF